MVEFRIKQGRKVAHIYGRPGMCSDDGRAINYYYQIATAVSKEVSFYDDYAGHFDTEEEARAFCQKNNLEVVGIGRG